MAFKRLSDRIVGRKNNISVKSHTYFQPTFMHCIQHYSMEFTELESRLKENCKDFENNRN